MARTKKSRKLQLIKEIKNQLNNEFHVTKKEVVASCFCGEDTVLPEDVLPFFESQYDIDLKSLDFSNWDDFAVKMAELILEKK